MIFKLFDIYNIVNTEKNIFLSAYIKYNIQFNNIDKEHNNNNIQLDNIIQLLQQKNILL